MTGPPTAGTPAARPGGSDRGVSFPLSHALTVAITTVLVSGLVVSAGGLLSEELSRTAERDLSSIGAALVADLEAADRIVVGANTTLTLEVSSPERVTGRPYLVSLTKTGDCSGGGGGSACVSLAVPGSDLRRTLPFGNRTPIANSTVTGGDVAIEYRDGTLTLVDRP